ncbi:MAG: Beta-mannosidase, partial [candidate division NC10 bacterium]|nr:Beta-mannosidase [candidate division NC10 bacterium]
MRRAVAITLLTVALAVIAYSAERYTRGAGVYPGNPEEDFAPVLVPDRSTYRNLALLRPAYHSSSYDFNLTAQLVTDGIRETRLPRRLVTTLSSTGMVKKHEREFLFDHNEYSNVTLDGPEPWMQFELAGGEAPLQIDRIDFQARFRTPRKPADAAVQESPGDWTCIVMGSDDGQSWSELGRAAAAIPPPPKPVIFGPTGSLVKASVKLTAPSRN